MIIIMIKSYCFIYKTYETKYPGRVTRTARELAVELFCMWHCSWSFAFNVFSGVRQGSVLSPYLFAVDVGDVGTLFGAHLGTYIVLYADDILLLAPSVVVLQRHVTRSLTQ